MKIKIIDLANKIINDELEDGFKILKDGNFVLVYNREDKIFASERGNIEYIKFDYFSLNKEVEIIEEDKEIKKINTEWFKKVDMFEPKSVELAIEMLANQLNEMIDVVNELKKGK